MKGSKSKFTKIKSNFSFLKYIVIVFVLFLNIYNTHRASALTCEYASTTPFAYGDYKVTFNNSSSTSPKDEVMACISLSANILNGYDSVLSFKLNDLYANLGQAACPILKYKMLQPLGHHDKVKENSFKSENDVYFNPGFSIGNKDINDYRFNTKDLEFNTRCYYRYEINPSIIKGDGIYMSFDTSNWDVFAKSSNYTNKLATSQFQAGYYGEILYEQSDGMYNLPLIERGTENNQFLTKYMKSEDFNFNKPKASLNPVSDIIFLPGIMGSNLYKTDYYHSSTSPMNKIWPSIFTSDQLKMKIDNTNELFKYGYNYDSGSDRVSVEADLNDKLYAGVTRTVYAIDVYDSFLSELDKLKANNEMTDYSAIPYDFRLATDNIYCDGLILHDKVYYNTNKLANRDYYRPWSCQLSFIYQDLQKHIARSKTGKVTLIGHSYGGLVIKEFLKQLEDSKDPLINKIDKVILVAVPQGGAPESVINILHGKAIGYVGLPINAKTERELALTFPSVYQLLPSEALIKSVNRDTGSPLISFISRQAKAATNTPADYSKQINKYGNTIDNFVELSDYLLNKENSIRATTTDDLRRAASIYSNLLTHSVAEKSKLDNYVPTSTIEIHQIAGWGLPTDIGYVYDYLNMCLNYNNDGNVSGSTVSIKLNCTKVGSESLLNVILSKDGDDTVPTASALWMSTTTNSNVHNWWVDLFRYNTSKGFINFTLDKVHKNILASTPALNKVLSLVRGKDNNIQYISNTTPIYNNKNYITYSAHSPVNITITDSNGNITGFDNKTNTIVNNINDVYYRQIGDTKLIIAPADINHTINLSAYDDGVYTLNVDTYNSDGAAVSTSTYYAIPTATNSQSYIKHDVLATTTDLILDYNHNGKVDGIIILSKSDASATYTASSTLPDITPTADYLSYIKSKGTPPQPKLPLGHPHPGHHLRLLMN